MFEVHYLDKNTNKNFVKVFWGFSEYKNFVRKCSYSKVINIISITDNSKYYD